MSKFEQMKEAKLQATAAQSEVSQLIRSAKQRFDTESQDIVTDRHLTAEGRRHKLDELREQIGTEIKDNVDKLRKQYVEADAKARELARGILTESKHEKPSDGEIALFQRELTDLKTELMLESRYISALEKIRAFEDKYKDGYFAAALLDEMSGFIQTVVGLADNKDEARAVLKRMHSDIKHRSQTDEQREAAQILENDRPALISRAGADYGVLNSLFGAHTAYTITQEDQ